MHWHSDHHPPVTVTAGAACTLRVSWTTNKIYHWSVKGDRHVNNSNGNTNIGTEKNDDGRNNDYDNQYDDEYKDEDEDKIGNDNVNTDN